MGWIKVGNHASPLHAKQFLFSHKLFIEDGVPIDELRQFEDRPELLTALLMSYLERAKPELKDAMPWSINFDYSRLAFGMTVLHASLPEWAMGCEVASEYVYLDRTETVHA